ncbi:unnamed protein product [Diplocarpon coronariae]
MDAQRFPAFASRDREARTSLSPYGTPNIPPSTSPPQAPRRKSKAKAKLHVESEVKGNPTTPTPVRCPEHQRRPLEEVDYHRSSTDALAALYTSAPPQKKKKEVRRRAKKKKGKGEEEEESKKLTSDPSKTTPDGLRATGSREQAPRCANPLQREITVPLFLALRCGKPE